MQHYRFFCTIAAAVLLLSACSAQKKKPEDGSTRATVPNTAAEDTTAEGGAEISLKEETTSERELPAANTGRELQSGCFYGEDTGTSQTLTGFSPLPPNPFDGALDPPERTFSKKTLEHGFGVAKNGQPHEISLSNQRFFDENGFNAVCLDLKTEESVLYLTFDCGYENGYTSKILDTLRDKDVKAAFFCTLPQMKENRPLIARMIKEGHIVGNHSVTHPDFSRLSREQMLEEVKGFDDDLRLNFGYSALYFRFPEGKYSEDSLDMLGRMGYRCVFWSLAYVDWQTDSQKGAEYAVQTILDRLHPGAVILLHAVSKDNAEGLGDIIDGARKKGYVFRALSDLSP